MISSRCTRASLLVVTIRPPFESRANVFIERSMSSGSCGSTGLTSTPREGATAWIAPSCPPPVRAVGSRITATRETTGAISLRSSSHLALIPNSNCVKPVALPPGRARVSTTPVPTGSVTFTNTIGTLRLARCNEAVIVAPAVSTTSGLRLQFQLHSCAAFHCQQHPIYSQKTRCVPRSSPVVEALHGTQRLAPFLRDRARYSRVRNRPGAYRRVAAHAPRAATPPRRQVV